MERFVIFENEEILTLEDFVKKIINTFRNVYTISYINYSNNTIYGSTWKCEVMCYYRRKNPYPIYLCCYLEGDEKILSMCNTFQKMKGKVINGYGDESNVCNLDNSCDVCNCGERNSFQHN